MNLATLFQQAADVLRTADGLLIGSGAGMGVDSGLPDFRGNEGFWKAYPPFRGKSFVEMANPVWFNKDPGLAWGFYGHRLQLYRDTVPHEGFTILRQWAERMPCGYFVFTSNVDGHFQKAGFDKEQVVECHGSIHTLQCARPCSNQLWSAVDVTLAIDPETFRARPPWPSCPGCGGVARPNVLMFGDFNWVEQQSNSQWRHYLRWLEAFEDKRIVAIELGAGTAIPSVRVECERRATTLIRINPREADIARGISLQVGALEAILGIHRYLK